MRRDLTALVRAFLNKDVRRNVMDLNRELSVSPDWRIGRLIHAGNAIIANDPLTLHDGHFVVNSFLPPIDTEAYRRSSMLAVPGLGTPDFLANQISGKRSAPISTYIAVTSRCPYDCWHCSASRFTSAEATTDLPTSEMLGVVDGLVELGVGIIGFTGGEPLMRSDLEELVSRAADGGVTTFVFSSGAGMTRQRADALKAAGLFGVAISYDSTDAAAHDVKRGHKGAHAAATSALKACAAAGLYTMTQTVCTRAMLGNGEIRRIGAVAKRIGVHEMRIIEPLPCGSLAGDTAEILSDAEKRRLVQMHVELNADSAMPKVAVFAYTESEAQFGCGAGVQHSYVDTQGNLLPCDFVNESFGNLLAEPAADLWARMHGKYSAPSCECRAKCPNAKRGTPGFYRRLAGERVPAVDC